MAYLPFDQEPSPYAMMNLPTREQAGVLIVSVSGAQGHPPVLLDFGGVDYISSAGLRVLMMASRRAKAQKGAFAIAALQPLVQEVFAISRFNLIVPCYASVDSACKVLGS
ncbi:MAG: anti-sigma factor antagonist [Betaproteobacteria bacterium HGW-Betaproteobacteria-6]|nr:MAG: anti-sigma factor antagonist [Betaproteobacteria bacterium HGW-Betaproteobacteria-6]